MGLIFRLRQKAKHDLNTENTEEIIFFNRIVDTEHIQSIHINGEELPVK